LFGQTDLAGAERGNPSREDLLLIVVGPKKENEVCRIGLDSKNPGGGSKTTRVTMNSHSKTKGKGDSYHHHSAQWGTTARLI